MNYQMVVCQCLTDMIEIPIGVIPKSDVIKLISILERLYYFYVTYREDLGVLYNAGASMTFLLEQKKYFSFLFRCLLELLLMGCLF